MILEGIVWPHRKLWGRPLGNGLKHVVIQLQYAAGNAAVAAQTGENALPKSWGYNSIAQVSYRIGGSSQ